MFDRIAPRYDLLNRVLSAGTDVRWRRAAVEALALTAGARVLDVCTGTADLLIEAVRRGDGRSGIGVDLSGEMLARGRSKLAGCGLSRRALLVQGDAERLPVSSGSVDGVLVAFGIRNVSDTVAGLSEMRRALRPGGRAVVLEFSLPSGVTGVFYRFYFRRVLPLVGALVSGERSAYRYLPASVARFPQGAAFGELMRQAGFSDVGWRPLSRGIAHLYWGANAVAAGGPAAARRRARPDA